MDDAEQCASRGSVETARAIYAHALKVFPNKKSIWIKAAYFEKAKGTQYVLWKGRKAKGKRKEREKYIQKYTEREKYIRRKGKVYQGKGKSLSKGYEMI